MESIFYKIKQDNAPEIINVVIEITKGDYNKYELNKEYGILECDRVLYGPTAYPVNYADVPRTWNTPDNDPADAVVFSTYPLLPGSLVEARVVGLMEMIDNGESDNKIITVNNNDPRFNDVKDVSDLPEWNIKDLKTFFEIYKYAQTGPGTVQVPGVLGKEEAQKFVMQVIEDYKKKFNN